MIEEKKIKARENAKKYYQKHRERILARQKKYVRERYHTDEEFRKKTLENHKRYEQNNLERVKKIKRDAQKKYYENHKEYYRDYSKKWAKSEREKIIKRIEELEKTIYELEIGLIDINEKIKEVANVPFNVKEIMDMLDKIKQLKEGR